MVKSWQTYFEVLPGGLGSDVGHKGEQVCKGKQQGHMAGYGHPFQSQFWKARSDSISISDSDSVYQSLIPVEKHFPGPWFIVMVMTALKISAGEQVHQPLESAESLQLGRATHNAHLFNQLWTEATSVCPPPPLLLQVWNVLKDSAKRWPLSFRDWEWDANCVVHIFAIRGGSS